MSNAIERRSKRKKHSNISPEELAQAILENRQRDPLYPLEHIEGGQTTRGNRTASRSSGHVPTLLDAFSANQKTPKEKLKVRKKVVRNGKEEWKNV